MPQPANQAPDRLLRKPEVLERIGVSAATLERMEARGDFPARVQISKRAIGWSESAVSLWIVLRQCADVLEQEKRGAHAPQERER